MPRRRMLAPINTIKHYVHRSNVSVVTGTLQTNPIVESVAGAADANAFEVKEGSVVKAIYVELWVTPTGASGTNTQVILILEKEPGGITVPMTFAQSQNLGAYPNKKNILFVTQGVQTSSLNGANAVVLMRNWFLIPKGKQRMGLGDRLVLHVSNLGTNAQSCGLFTYKEFR